MTTVANEPDILSQQQQDPAAKNTQGFQSVTLPFETNVPTIGDRNEFTGGQPFDWESVLNVPDELSSLETFLVGISGGPDLCYNNAPLLGPFHTDHGEHGSSQDGIAENFNGDFAGLSESEVSLWWRHPKSKKNASLLDASLFSLILPVFLKV
uniref:Uncharacterized protein n=1 Tax=Quercus lobata TaxID=97700 RepID=A0A7N2LM08_QUELO